MERDAVQEEASVVVEGDRAPTPVVLNEDRAEADGRAAFAAVLWVEPLTHECSAVFVPRLKLEQGRARPQCHLWGTPEPQTQNPHS